MSRAVFPHHRLRPLTLKGVPVAYTSVSRKAHKGKAKTNLGRYRGLECCYWKGKLTHEQEQSFERICYDLHRLYKGAAS